MIFIIAAVFILIISFAIALFSLIREQSKIEKENVSFDQAAGQPQPQEPQAMHTKIPEPQLATPIAPQVDTQQIAAQPLHEKPWWESEIQKRETVPPGQLTGEHNLSQIRHPGAEIGFPSEEPSKASQTQSGFGVQHPRGEEKNLQGSFSVSELAEGDQES